MLKITILIIFIAVIFLYTNAVSYATEHKSYICGLADGYPPYQFKTSLGNATGFDADVLRLVFKQAQKGIVFHQEKWGDIIALLLYTKTIDCVGGMEINEVRKKRFDITSPYYFRRIAIFINSDTTNITSVDDLIGKKIAGDKDSSIEIFFKKKGMHNRIRIKQTKSKEESMSLLKNREIVAIIAPKEVGFYLAKQLDVKVKILLEAERGTPVGITVKKGNSELLNVLETALQEVIKAGKIRKLYDDWFKRNETPHFDSLHR